MAKKILIGVGIVILILVGPIWQVVTNLDSIVAGMIETTGTEVMQTDVRVSGVEIKLKEGKAGITGMTIANPDGFSSAKLFEIDRIKVNLDLQSMGKDVLVIEAIRIHNPRIAFEANESGGSNMQTLLDNISGSSSADADKGASGAKALKLIIDHFEISGGQVEATTPIKPGKVTKLSLPTITMKDIGRSQGGVSAEVAVEQITRKLANEVIESTLKVGVNKAMDEKKSGFMDQMGDLLKGDG